MEAKKLCPLTDRVHNDWSAGEEVLLFEEWYRSCEQNPALLQQVNGADQEAMRERLFLSITKNLSFQKHKLFLVVV